MQVTDGCSDITDESQDTLSKFLTNDGSERWSARMGGTNLIVKYGAKSLFLLTFSRLKSAGPGISACSGTILAYNMPDWADMGISFA